LNARRRATLHRVAATFAPPDARIERVTELAARAIDGLTPRRRRELYRLFDLLSLPMKASDGTRAFVLRALANSRVGKLRTGFAAVKRLTLFLAYAESEPGSENPTWTRIGYPGPRHDANADSPRLPLAIARNAERVRADVVVIGSGAGGGVAASAFARAGKRVVVLEAGGTYDARGFTQRELMTAELYLDAGLTSSRDLGISILAGATVGGGTTVNWCTSLQLPERIAREWEAQSGIARLGAELAPHFDSVRARLNVGPAARHNANNRVILDGARALGVHAEESPRNASRECGDGCGFCGFGCAYGRKWSTAVSLLPDVAANGGTIYANTVALRIETNGKRARAVVARQTIGPDDVRSFEVEADAVVVAAGALRTPGILARSCISHPLLGKRLFLHPVAASVAEFERPIEPWIGPMQSAHSDAFNYRSGNYGAKIEVAPAHPGLAASAVPWQSRAQHAELMERMRNVATLFALTRDRDPGCIDLDDEAYIRYRVSPHDGENLLAGLAGTFDLAFAAGAIRVLTLHAKPLEVRREEWTSRYREEFLERLRAIGVAANRQIFFSAHQMGTAAMGADANRSVVDPAGRVWGYENLLVADASVFPQSSGVNPMLTIMAMASRIADQHGGASISS
jgi:choline dehydrogenase-like flavoprotein